MTLPNEQDPVMAQLLRQSLKRASAVAASDSCLEADTAAAWMDGGLSGEALASARTHVADCARCQALVAALVRTQPHASVPARADRRRFGWFAPAAAVAAALTAMAIWQAMPRNPSLTPTRQIVAPRPAAEEQRPVTPPQLVQPKPDAAASPSGSSPAALGQRSTDPVRNETSPPPPSTAAKAAVQETTSDLKDVNGAPLRRDTGQAAASRAAAPAAAPAAAAASTAAFSDGLPTGKTIAGLSDAVGVQILSPNPAVRWRIVATAVQHSVNGGATWEAASIGTTAQLSAGSAPSTTICWLVGRGGVILRLTDGVRWTRIAFPEPTDLSAVRAIDALRATVTTADGRTFTTADGGTSWTGPTPQDF